MPHETEAACLLRTGNLFSRRVGLREAGGSLVFAGIKPGAFALYQDDAPYYHFDLDGRWQRAFIDGIHYRKALNGSVVAIDRVREGPNLVLRRRELGFSETADLDATVRVLARELSASLDAGRLELVAPPGEASQLKVEELRTLLDRIEHWDTHAWFDQRERHFEAYGPVSFLPPDAQHALILQATLGHPDGRAFGAGQARAHHVRDLDEFEVHLRSVTTLLGRRLAQCRTVFLGGPDVLRLPFEQVLALLETIGRHLPLGRVPAPARRSDRDIEAVFLSGIDVFLDDFRPPFPDAVGWSHLAALGLGRVTLGIESGDPEVRRLFGQSWTDDDLARLVSELKAAGIPLGLVLLVGAGGQEHEARHAAATAGLVNDLPLGRDDLITLVDAAEVGDATLSGRVQPLEEPARAAQQDALRAALAPSRERLGVKVVPYSLQKQWN